ncbi:MAG: threonine synthase, partial [Candidatus Scatosoma sp.]
MYVSTRGGERVTASRAIIKGLAADGGLFVPEKTEEIGFDESYAGKDYKTFARKIFAAFFDDFTPEEIDEAVERSYNEENFPEAFARVNTVKESGGNGGFSLLELYHGPTLAFKDMALTALPHLLNIAKRKNGESGKTLVLVATSGDTGGAALSGFGGAAGYDTLVLYPAGGVSEVQERQMLHFTSARTNALAIQGNFDDCQTFVKRIFAQYPENGAVKLCSANSINIGRLVPQIVYYAYAYFTLVKRGVIRYGERIDAVVPTGNFGDILAGYLAKKIGVPYGTFVCASNKNNVLTEFFETGVYDKNRPFYKSNSPAMDILVSSNLERLLYFASGENAAEVKGYMSALENCGRYEISAHTKGNLGDFACGFADEKRTLAAIKRAHDTYKLLIDPHTAVAFDCYEAYVNQRDGQGGKKRHTLIV